jgi:hypothetical protein
VKKPHWRSRVAFFGLLAALGLVVAVTPVIAGSTATGKSSERALTEAADGNFEVLEQADQYAEARTAPADVVDAGAFSGAYLAAKNLPLVGGSWSEITTTPYNSDAHGYRDPVWSNSGGGAGHVAGRMTALAVDGSTLYAGAADGGVWRRSGGTWTPLTDDAPTLSVGALAVDPSHGLWVGTGEANTSSDSYAGIGVLYSGDGGATFSRVGGNELDNHTIGRIVYDNGFVLIATSQGVYRHSASPSSFSQPWTAVLREGVAPLPTACAQAGGVSAHAFATDVAVKPNTGGNVVDAVLGWRAGSNCNGIYESTDGGAHFSHVTVTGALNEGDMGRTTIAYSAGGGTVYALVQSAGMFNHARTDQGGTILQGVYKSDTGIGGSWTKVAEWRNLQNNTGSALGNKSKGYHPGVQAWYNQFLAVDPSNAKHVFLGLEEVFESFDGGATWKAAGPYWNFGLPCSAGGLDNCPPTTHPDQHAIAFGNDGKVYVGNDGGVYSRNLNASSSSFASINDGLNTLQYYYADAGPVAGGDAIWGGLQDNGVSLLSPGGSEMVSPFGGDGGDNIVDHTNGNRAVNEYVGLDMALTTNGGRSNGAGDPAYREITPSCSAFTYTPSPCDPNPRFIAPFEPDSANPNHWVAGGEFVWDNQGKGWDTTCGASSCDWKIAFDTGPGRSITAIGVNDRTYVAWCGPCNRAGFARGIATNYGGSWHQLSLPTSFPNRFIQGLTVDPANPAHVYVVFNGFSRRWTNTFSAGEGHVFETTDGGATWTDISGNLPDAPGDDLVLTTSGKLVEASDIGVFVANAGQGAATTWSRFGTLPNVSVNDLQLSPDGSYIIAATHGRGLWRIATA